MKKILGIVVGLVVIMAILLTIKIQGGQESTITIPIQTLEEIASDSEGSILSSDTSTSVLDTSELFSDRDLIQTPDLTQAIYMTLSSGQVIEITEEGTYVLSGNVTNTTVKVTADDKAKVQLVLDGAIIVNDSAPAIYVKSADKVYITTTATNNQLSTTGSFIPDGDTNLDAVIYSKSDLVLNGVGSLDILSEKGNGVTSKDDLKVTGGSYTIAVDEDGLEANDSIRIYDGELNITSSKDAIHSENEDDLRLGYIYIADGSLIINAGDDGIRANSIVQIDNGDIRIETCVEGIEGSYIQINDGVIDIYSTNDAINAANKSVYPMKIEVNGGDIALELADGDTDGFDSNGDLTVKDGTINVSSAMAAFDVDGIVTYTGGVITVDGEVVDEIEIQTIGFSEFFQSKF